jgi:hypothetical protein
LNLRGVGNIIDRGTGTIVLNSEFRKTFYEKMVCTPRKCLVDSGTWRKAGGDLGDLLICNIRIYSGGPTIHTQNYFDAILELIMVLGLQKMVHKG